MTKKKSQNPIVEMLSVIEALNEKQVSIVAENISTYNSPSSYKILPDELKVEFDVIKASNLFTFLKYAQDDLGNSLRSKEVFKTELSAFLETHSISKSESEKWANQLSEKLLEIFSVNKNLENVEWHQTGVIDKLLDFDSFIDLRPIFTENEISDLIPLIVFRLAIHKDYENPKSFVFQMTVEELEDLESKIKETKSKLEQVINRLSSKSIRNLFVDKNV